MFINSVSQTSFTSKPNTKAIIVGGKRLVPRSEYKGPELKLTTEDEQKIASLRDGIAEIALRRIALEEYYGNSDFAINKRDNYDNAFIKLDWECDMLLDQIEKIKRNRHTAQMTQAKEQTL